MLPALATWTQCIDQERNATASVFNGVARALPDDYWATYIQIINFKKKEIASQWQHPVTTRWLRLWALTLPHENRIHKYSQINFN